MRVGFGQACRAGVDSAAVPGPSTTETWDSFFSDFYLRAYAGDERDVAGRGGRARRGAAGGGGARGGRGRRAVRVRPAHARARPRRATAPSASTGRGTLLDEARRRSGGERWPKLTRADYRELPFAEESFDAAFNLFTSLGYLGDEEDVKVLAAIRRVLRPDGKLVLETMHRDRLVTNFSEYDWHLLGEGRLLLEQRTWDPVTGVAQSTQTLIDRRGRARVAHLQRPHLHARPSCWR